jgi:hypothetical protein
LPTDQRAGDEGRRACSACPAVLECRRSSDRPGGGQCESIGERRNRRERSRVKGTDHQQRPEASRRQEPKSNDRGKSRAHGEDGPERLCEVGKPSAKRSGDQPKSRADCEQKPDLFWYKPSRLEERRHEWR